MTNQPVVAITGGTRGLGYALAETLLSSGFAVSLCARSKNGLETVKRGLSEYGPTYVYEADVANEQEAKAWIDSTVEQFGRIDALVHNASNIGDTPMPLVRETTPENLRKVYESNVIAPVVITQATLALLTAQPLGVIVSISSDAAQGGYPTWGTYGASKAALDLITLTLSQELRDTSVSVFCVDPGDMDTDMHHQAAPMDTGLPDASLSAQAMLPLFRPLVTHDAFDYPSGSRLVVRHGAGSPSLSRTYGGEAQ